ncbi:MAG: cupin domain-containing protein [Chloroflexi bacterium]|jgi:quercetin dioxygenase-like cupin family protein|nr:cupin domain-containing protein [Chloroflexota bacterium]
MKAFHYTEIEAQPTEGAPGASIRWAIGKNVGAPNFVTRVIEIEPGGATPYHQHPWEHEVFVLDGAGVVKTVDGETPISPRMCVYVSPDEEHQFRNTGDQVLRFLCIIPFAPWYQGD